MPESWIAAILKNFSLAMFVVSAIFILLHRAIKRGIPEAEIVYRWVALFALGFAGIYAFIMHAFYPVLSASTIGWLPSPFQYEVAMANLGFGVVAILSFNASYPFRLAAVIANTCWLWGDAVGHLYQMMAYHNYTIGNTGSWLWMDILIPLILIICICRLKPVR